MRPKHRPGTSGSRRHGKLTFIIRRKLADWLPYLDWILFVLLWLAIILPFLTYFLPREKRVALPRLPEDAISQQWYLDQIQARPAWSITLGSKDVIVAVIDTGVDYTHHDLAPNIWVNTAEIPNDGVDNDHNHYIDDYFGWDFIDNDGDPMPGEAKGAEHGTMVAGIIGAVHDNGGIEGVSGNVRLMTIRVRTGTVELDSFLPCSQGQYGYYLAQGIRYAADNGAKVINLSLTSSLASQQLGHCVQDAVWYAFCKDVVMVAAAGNNNENIVSFPASMIPVIAVGATNKQDQRLSINGNEGSNYGAALDVVAPGVDIWTTTINNQYKRSDGTSLAAPQVAGLAALLLSIEPHLSVTQVKDYIEMYTQKIEGYQYVRGWNEETGWGRIDVYRVLYAASLDSQR